MLMIPAVSSGMPLLDTIYNCEVLTMLKAMPSDCIDCVVTSPPYYGLRSYLPDGHDNKHLEIGLEQTPREFVDKLVRVFREVRRVLKPSGTCWLNMGDSWAGGGGYYPDAPSNQNGSLQSKGNRLDERNIKGLRYTGLASKQLLMIPARVAIALQDDGWWLRSEIIWSKPNPMPESVKDRPTKAHEMVYLLTKAPSYWYDADAIREQLAESSIKRYALANGRIGTYSNGDGFESDNPIANVNSPQYKRGQGRMQSRGNHVDHLVAPAHPNGANARSVWSIPTEPTPFAHFATFPTKLVERCIRTGCPSQVCSVCGKPYERMVEDTPEYALIKASMRGKTHVADPLLYGKGQGHGREKARVTKDVITIGFNPTCTCNADTRPGVVLDPFGGSGTVGLVAREWGRRFLLCDLNPEYVKLAQSRLAVPFTLPMFA